MVVWLFTLPKQMLLGGNGLKLIVDLNVTISGSLWIQNRAIVLSAWIEDMSFFESEIVQEEAKKLFTDYQNLMQLGSDYGKFDREGKVMFIDTMENLMERYKVFMKRFELSEDFQAKMTVEQLKTQLSQFGITPDQMFDQMNKTLVRMKSELDK